jgi:RNA recognition motif-containing protein
MKYEVLVGNISADTAEDLLRSLFAGTVGVLNISIPTDPKSNKNRGYAVVQMSTSVQAEEAARDLQGKLVDGRAVTCSVVPPATKPKWYELKAQTFKKR